jgi:hypothetical protein
VALRYLAAAVTAGALAFFWQAWPYKLGLLGAVLVGVAVGVVLSRPRKPIATTAAEADADAADIGTQPAHRQPPPPRHEQHEQHAIAGGRQ